MLRRLITFQRLQYLVEIFIIVMLAWVATDGYHNFDPNWRLAGIETEYLTSSAEWVAKVFKTSHYIPKWQPYLDAGQPVIDEAYAFVVNPFTGIPILLYGGANSLKVSIILHFVIVGVGGWFLGWTLGWRWLARLLVGCLLILKGNMQGTLGMGFFQLGVAQAYFPWVFAGALAIVHYPSRRWPLVLLALALALLYLAGNIYYVLPILILVGLIVAFFCLTITRTAPYLIVDTTLLKRFGWAAVLTLGLVAVTALTIGLNYGLVHGHPDVTIGVRGDVNVLLELTQFVEPTPYVLGLFAENLYTYSAPLWFVALLIVFLPPIPLLHRSATRQQARRLWVACLAGLLLFITWGLAINPVINWIYQHLPFIGQWRYPERMMTVAAFLFIFLLALRLDGLYRAVVLAIDYRRRRTGIITRVLITASLAAACGVAVAEVQQTRFDYDYLWKTPLADEQCLRWMNATYPGRMLSVKRVDYGYVTPYMRAGIRLQTVGAAYDLSGPASILYPYNLTDIWPEFYMTKWDDDLNFLRSKGYEPEVDSPVLGPDLPVNCVWRNKNALPYAFSIPLDTLRVAEYPLPTELTSPVAYLGRIPEHIWLNATPAATAETVVVAQDIAYPGWTALVDGQPADVVSVGELLGVVLPPGSAPVQVEFVYSFLTLKIGSAITIITAIASILYLLRLDLLLLWIGASLRRFGHYTLEVWGRTVEQLTAAPAAQSEPPPPPAENRVITDVSVAPLQPAVENTAAPEAENTAAPDTTADPLYPTVQVETDYTLIRVIVPPSNKQTRVEIAYPATRPSSQPSNGAPRRRGLRNVISAPVVFLYLLVTGRRRKD